MRLVQRLQLGSLAVMAVLLLAIIMIAGGRLRDRLIEQQSDALLRAARVIAAGPIPDGVADSLADVAGKALGYRVTLVDTGGRVTGDSEFDGASLGGLENHRSRPEVAAALARGMGTSMRQSPSAGDREMYAAVRHAEGVVRVSIGMSRVEEIVDGAERDVMAAALLAFAGAALLAWLFARSVSTPIVELRDIATAIARGDLSGRPALAAPGEIGDLAAALHEMAEQLAVRLAALREDDARLTAVVESLNEGVLAISPRGTVVRMNDRAHHFLRLREALPVESDRLPRNARLREVIAAALAGTATEPTELQLFGRTLAVTARPLEAGGAVVALFDLTAIRRLELVRSDFVANVSHELKTPLTVVRGFAETLQDPALAPEDRRRFTEAIVANAGRMQRIVDDLLDLSRIESGGWVPNPGWLEVRDLVDEAFAAVRPAADAKGLTLETRVEADVVFADVTAARQVVGNLVENAVRYTASGGVVVQVRPGDGMVAIAVRDTGIGIAPEHLSRIFERFYRADRARARSDGGTGLGLAIVKHLVEAHGGHVRAESVLGQGTTITASFPDPSAGS